MSDNHVDSGDRALDALLRGMEHEDLELLEPPDEVWQGIQEAIGTEEDTSASVLPLRPRRRTATRVLIGIAAALVVAVIGVAAFLAVSDEAGEILATATLRYDPVAFDPLGAAAEGAANLVSHDGRLTIDIVGADLPSPGKDADLEVWLIRPDQEGNVADLVSLGAVSPTDPESLEVPESHDPGLYFVVDISVEPRDGDAGHSGRTILRGPLTNL